MTSVEYYPQWFAALRIISFRNQKKKLKKDTKQIIAFHLNLGISTHFLSTSQLTSENSTLQILFERQPWARFNLEG